MKLRFVLPLGLAVVATAVAGLVSPGGSSGQGSPYNSVNGAVKVTFPDFPAPGESTTEQLVISAHDGPRGPKGSIEFRSPLAEVPVAKADVTCLLVTGSEARVGGTFREPFLYTARRGDPAVRISHFLVQLLDNGSPGQGTPDAVHPVVFREVQRPPTFSPCQIQQLLLYPVDQGNLVVNDAATG